MKMVSLIDGFQSLNSMGFFALILPFTLIFAVLYAAMSMANVFGKMKDGGKRIRVLVAMVLSLLVVIPHITGGYPAGADPINIINQSVPQIALIVVAILMFFILLGMFGVPININNSSSIGPLVGIICLGLVIFIFGRSAGWFGSGPNVQLPSWLGFLNDPEVVSVLLVILVFVGIVAFITGGENPDSKSFFSKIGEEIQKVMK